MALEHFEGESYCEDGIRALLPRIYAAPHPEMSMASTQHFGAEVRVTLKDGRVLTRKVDRPLGRGPEVPLPVELLEAKFLDCANHALTPEASRDVLGMLWRIDGLDDITTLTALLEAGLRH